MRSSRGNMVPELTIAVSSAIWGLLWIPLRGLEDSGIPSAWVVFAFYFPAFIVSFGIFVAYFGRNRRQLLMVILAGTFAGLALALYSLGLILTTVVRATMLFYLTPVWGTLFGMLWLGERPGFVRAAVLVLGMLGLALLLGATPGDVHWNVGIGEVVGFLSGIFWALAVSILKKYNHLPISGVTFFQYIVVLASMVAFALWLPSEGGEWSFGLSTVLYLIPSVLILGSIYAIFHATKRVSPGRAGLLMMTEAVVAVFSASVMLPEEVLSPTEWAGAAVIILAAFLEIWAGEPDSKPARQTSDSPQATQTKI